VYAANGEQSDDEYVGSKESKKRPKEKSKENKFPCVICGELGHWKNECPLKTKWEEFIEKEKGKGTDRKKEIKGHKDKSADLNEFRLTSIEKALAELTASISGKKKKDPDDSAASKNAMSVFGWLGGPDGDGLHDGIGQDFAFDDDDADDEEYDLYTRSGY